MRVLNFFYGDGDQNVTINFCDNKIFKFEIYILRFTLNYFTANSIVHDRLNRKG